MNTALTAYLYIVLFLVSMFLIFTGVTSYNVARNGHREWTSMGIMVIGLVLFLFMLVRLT